MLSLSHGADGNIIRFDATGTYPTFVIGSFHYGLTKGKWSATIGYNNAATGDYSATLGGSSNEAAGNRSAVIGGIGNISQDTDQIVFGHFNNPQTGYVEIVGNGTDANNKSNARTLDWSGNEVLAGGLTTGDDVSVTGDISATGDATIGGAATVTGAVSANGITSSDDVSVTGDISATGGLNLGRYLTRKLPTLVANTTYLGTRFEDENGTGRGGLGFYYVTQYGEGIRLYTTRGGVNNSVAMFIDANGNSSVVFGQPDAWRAGLNVSANYAAGDTISFPTTGNSYYTRFHGDWRDTKNLYFLIPTSRSCVGLTATVSGLIYLVTNGVRNSVNMSNVTPTCFCTESGIAVRLTWSTAPSYAVQYNLASVQPYGFTVTFS